MKKGRVITNKTPREIIRDLESGIKDVQIPDSFYQTLLEQFLERDYLNFIEDKKFLECSGTAVARRKNIRWLKVTRLPVHPNENESYNLLSRWQGVLSSLHVWGYRLIFLIVRNNGKTELFLGTVGDKPGMTPNDAIEQLKVAAFGSMPGMGLDFVETGEPVYNSVINPLSQMNYIGAVTGIPTGREDSENQFMQTLDQLAFGIRDSNGNEEDYAMMVIADPIDDAEIADIIMRFRDLGSKIHTGVRTAISTSSRRERTEEEKKEMVTEGVLSLVLSAIAMTNNFGAGLFLAVNLGKRIFAPMLENGESSDGKSDSFSTDFLDKFAEYAEKACEHHVDRLNQGRNFGFWNTGVYILGKSPKTVTTVNGMLRSIYSGDDTYYEPIRMHLFSDINALLTVRNNFELLPLTDVKLADTEFNLENDEWHLLGKRYQYVSTPLNTKELSIATSLPRRDVPGLRFVKTAVRFANNPAEIETDKKITLGNIVDMGISTSAGYDIDVDSLVRHGLVTGATGSGKSTTCKKIVSEVMAHDIPVMIIEPAKDDYVRWAIEQNKTLPKDKQFKIFMPGVDEFEGVKLEKLEINIFEPAAPKGVAVDILQHSENAAMLLNACLPSEDVVPILIEEVVFETIKDYASSQGVDVSKGDTEPLASYPSIVPMRMKCERVMAKKRYMDQNKANLREVLETRFASLERGTRGRILNVNRSVDYTELFSGNVIINISRLVGTKDKSLIMSLLLQALYEYRIAQYTNDKDYRERAQANKLMHLMLLEEAHNVLLKPDTHVTSGNPQRAAADLFGNMLSEVRGYGQGFLIVDQVPTKLIDDAVKNTNYKIVHRIIAPDDQEVVSSSMALRDDQKYIIPALEKGNAIVCGDEDDAAVWVKIKI